jgi:hypothetical protein
MPLGVSFNADLHGERRQYITRKIRSDIRMAYICEQYNYKNIRSDIRMAYICEQYNYKNKVK